MVVTQGAGWLRPDERWTLVDDGGLLVAHAGADAAYGFDDVPEHARAALVAAWAAGSLDPAALPEGSAPVLEGLVGLDAVRADVAPSPGPARGGAAVPRVDVVVVGVGPAADRARAALDEALLATSCGPAARVGEGAPAFHVLVRVGGTREDLAAAASAAERTVRPCLLVDAAHHHTLVLGPLVLPDLAPCGGCLVLRMAERWPDLPAPPGPAVVTDRPALVAELVRAAVDQAVAGRSTLVGATTAIDVEALRATTDPLLRHPWCARCEDLR